MIKDSPKLKKLFLSLGYSEEDYKKIINNNFLISYKEETLYTKVLLIYNYLISLNYTKEEVIKMTKTLPAIYGLSIDNMKQKIKDVMELGYTKKEVIKMTKMQPQIYCYNIENMKQKIKDLIELGYTKAEVIKITKILPTIYGYNIENMKQKIKDVMSLGYTKEEVIKMTRIFPAIYSYSIENIKQKTEFYDSIDMHKLAIIDPKQLMQSTALSYARYMFYKEKEIDININNYKKLFIGQVKFKKSYGITNKELLKMYDYNKYLEEKNNGRTI